MIPTIPTDPIVQYGAAIIFGVGLVGFGYFQYRSSQLQKNFEDNFEYDQVVDIAPPRVKNERFGLLKSVREHRKKERLLNKGYVQWFLVDESFPRPKFVKPKPKDGGGIPELKESGITYLFPREGRLPSQDHGIWTYVHRKGESDPVNLQDPNELSIPADVLSEYLTMRVTSSAPGLLSGLGFGFGDMDSMDMLRYSVLALIAIFIILKLMNGGL